MRAIGKKILGGILLLGTLFGMSCNTDIDVNAPNLDVPIVYCLLNTEDSVQYLKLNKTYLLYTAAMENPPESDSMYFDGDIQIVLEKWENNRPIDFYEFTRTSEIEKDTGFFPSDQNVLYATNAIIETGGEYMLNIYLKNKQKIVHAKTSAVGQLKVVDPIDIDARVISLNTGINYTTRWKPVDNAGIYQVVIRFKYSETKDGETVVKHMEWPQVFTNPVSNIDYLSRDISGTRFYYVVNDKLKAEEGVVRTALGIDFFIMSGGEELKFYIESIAPSDGALMEKPTYTNVTNGLGVFSSIATRKILDLPLASTTMDSLAYGQHTKHLMFLDHNGIRKDN